MKHCRNLWGISIDSLNHIRHSPLQNLYINHPSKFQIHRSKNQAENIFSLLKCFNTSVESLNGCQSDVDGPKDTEMRAFVTFLAGNGDYVKGIVGLAKGLRKAKSCYPLVVAVLPDVPEEHRQMLVSQGCMVRRIEPIYPPENQTQFAMAYQLLQTPNMGGNCWNITY